MSTNDLRAGQLLPDHLLEVPGHVTLTADRHLTGRPPAHHKSRSRGLANIDPKFTSQVRPLQSLSRDGILERHLSLLRLEFLYGFLHPFFCYLYGFL
jgi:hypothetical protein